MGSGAIEVKRRLSNPNIALNRIIAKLDQINSSLKGEDWNLPLNHHSWDDIVWQAILSAFVIGV